MEERENYWRARVAKLRDGVRLVLDTTEFEGDSKSLSIPQRVQALADAVSSQHGSTKSSAQLKKLEEDLRAEQARSEAAVARAEEIESRVEEVEGERDAAVARADELDATQAALQRLADDLKEQLRRGRDARSSAEREAKKARHLLKLEVAHNKKLKVGGLVLVVCSAVVSAV